MMPLHLILIRHGQSEGNILEDSPDYASLLAGVPDNQLRLTPRGVEQAQAAGSWLREYLPSHGEFGGRTVGFVSTFIRAKETAAHLGLGLDWKDSPYIVERDWGHFNQLSPEDQARYRADKRRNPLYSAMPNGQSLSSLFPFNYIFFGMLHREHSADRVIAVCHGERLQTIRYQLERMSDTRFGKMVRSSALSDRVRNCQIIEYSRKSPDGKIANRYDWMRSLCPWDLREKDLRWKPIERSMMRDEDLRATVEAFPRYLS